MAIRGAFVANPSLSCIYAITCKLPGYKIGIIIYTLKNKHNYLLEVYSVEIGISWATLQAMPLTQGRI